MIKTKTTGLLFATLLLLPLIGGLFVMTPKVSAATITVTTTSDENSDPGPDTGCSLFEAIEAANTDTAYGGCTAGSGADTINVPAGIFSVALNPLNAIRDDLTILGDPAGGTIIDGGLISITTLGNDQTYLIRDITIRNSPDRGVSIEGQNEGYSATFDRVTVENNDSFGITHTRYTYVTTGAVYITNSVIRNNASGGLYNNECQGVGTMYVTNSMVIDNQETGINSVCGHLVLDRVTVSGNSSTTAAGGIQAEGVVDMTNVTVFDNSSSVTAGGLGLVSSTAALTNTTIANNNGDTVGGISSNGGSTLTLYNNLIANNQGLQCSDGLDVEVAEGSNNMSSDGSCSLYSDELGIFSTAADVKLASSLSDNGGAAPIGSGGLAGNVLTLALLDGSPAINAGNNAFCPVNDERDADRPYGSTCDIGAFEARYAAVTADSPSAVATLADTGQNSLMIAAVAVTLVISSAILGRYFYIN